MIHIPMNEPDFDAAALRILNSFAVDMMTIQNADDLLWYVAQNVVGRLNFVDCVIYTADMQQSELTQVAALGEKNPYDRSIVNPLKIPFGSGITGRVAQTREHIIVHDLLEDQTYIPDTAPARSELCVPMVFGNRVVGVIDSEHPDIGAYGPREVELLTTVAAMSSARLELLEETKRSELRYKDLVAAHGRLTREIDNRKALEAELFKARKLEAIGRLSGGFAHDFNNILTVISGNLDILLETMDQVSEDQKECLTAAQTAAAKGADAIRNMLAFSQRSRLTPEVMQLNDLVRATCAWGNNVLSESTLLNLELAEGLWTIYADKSATENALLNLMLNARDAMPSGGTLTITTENAPLDLTDIRNQSLQILPGNYVKLCVTDSGIGISEDRLQQVFDPFYTTKEAGAGTGLGLSMIFGFMQQSKGAVAATSKLGVGSTFCLYFPTSRLSG